MNKPKAVLINTLYPCGFHLGQIESLFPLTTSSHQSKLYCVLTNWNKELKDILKVLNCQCMIKRYKDLTFPFKLIAVVRGCVNVIKVQLCTFIQLVRENRTFTAIKCKTDVWSCKLFLCLLAMVYWIALGRYQDTSGYNFLYNFYKVVLRTLNRIQHSYAGQ